MYDYKQELEKTLYAADDALFHLREAWSLLKSAGNWGVVDIIGGGMLSTFVKHSKMQDAEYELECAKNAVFAFNNELNSVQNIGELTIDVSGFLSFADFFFDGIVADWLVQSRIKHTRAAVENTIDQIEYIKSQLYNKYISL